MFYKSWQLHVQYSSQKKKIKKIEQFSTPKNEIETQYCEMFQEVVHNFGKSDGDNGTRTCFMPNLIKKSVTVSNDKLIIYLLSHINALHTDILENVNPEWQ